MNVNHDPEETQPAPTEPFVTPPTLLAFENQPTACLKPSVSGASPAPALQDLAEQVDHLADQVGQVAYQVNWLQGAVFPQQDQPEQGAKQGNEIPWQQASLGAAGGGLLFTMNATISISKEWIIGLALVLLLLLVVGVCGYFAFRSAPAATA